MKLRTWHFEMAAVTLVLATVNLVFRRPLIEWVGAVAVLLSFGHANIADRMAEKQARMVAPDVECWRWSLRYFIGKELAWVAYFLLTHSTAALVGCAVFLLHPWRKWWRRRRDCQCDGSGEVPDLCYCGESLSGGNSQHSSNHMFTPMACPVKHGWRGWWAS